MNEIISRAINLHSKWTYYLEQAIKDGSAEFNPAIVKTDNNCEFGKWLYNEASADFKKTPIYLEIKEIHALFHEEASKILTLALNGNKAEAQKMLGFGSEYRRLSSSLVLKLASLKKK